MKIKLFSLLAEALGDQVTITLPAPTTPESLKAALQQAYPDYAELIAQSVVAVDQEYAAVGQVIVDTAEVALIPPVSGG